MVIRHIGRPVVAVVILICEEFEEMRSRIWVVMLISRHWLEDIANVRLNDILISAATMVVLRSQVAEFFCWQTLEFCVREVALCNLLNREVVPFFLVVK